MDLNVTVHFRPSDFDSASLGPATLYMIDDKSANAVDTWHQMGDPSPPSAEQLDKLQQAAKPASTQVHFSPAGAHGTFWAVIRLPKNAAYVVAFSGN